MKKNYESEIRLLLQASGALFELAEDWGDDLQERWSEFGGWALPSVDESASDIRAFANYLRGYVSAAKSKKDYFAEVIETLRAIREGIASLEDEDERLNHLDDAELWIRTHVLESGHPLAID